MRQPEDCHSHTPVRYRDGAIRDPLGREEAAVREQHELAEEIAQALSTCIERASKIELGRSAGPRLYRRLEVARASFERLAERDRRTLAEFRVYAEAEEQRRQVARTLEPLQGWHQTAGDPSGAPAALSSEDTPHAGTGLHGTPTPRFRSPTAPATRNPETEAGADEGGGGLTIPSQYHREEVEPDGSSERLGEVERMRARIARGREGGREGRA
jgi:hypothetical protein